MDKRNRNFTTVFDDRTSFRAKGLRRTSWNRNFTGAFGDRTSCRAKGLRRTSWNRNFTSGFDDRTSFRAKGFAGQEGRFEIAILPQFLQSNLISCDRVHPDARKSQFYLNFWRSNLISCERVAPDHLKSQFYLRFWRSNLISCERVAFRAVSLALPLPPAFKREMEKKERARGQEDKRRKCRDVRIWRWEDVRMRRCEDEQMWRWADVKMGNRKEGEGKRTRGQEEKM